MYFEDEKGRVTGMKGGKLLEEIPGSLALVPEMGGAFTDNEMYALPADVGLTINVVGQGESEYTLGMMGQHSLYSIEEKTILPGGTDKYVITPDAEAVEHSLRIIPGVIDKSFTIRFAHVFDGRVEALDRDFITREYILEGVSAGDDDDFFVRTEEGGDSIVVSASEGEVTFDAVTRSTESADYADEGITYIPGSREDDVIVAADETVVLYPEDWATTEEESQLHVLKQSKYRTESTTAVNEPEKKTETALAPTAGGTAGPTPGEKTRFPLQPPPSKVVRVPYPLSGWPGSALRLL